MLNRIPTSDNCCGNYNTSHSFFQSLETEFNCHNLLCFYYTHILTSFQSIHMNVFIYSSHFYLSYLHCFLSSYRYRSGRRPVGLKIHTSNHKSRKHTSMHAAQCVLTILVSSVNVSVLTKVYLKT